LNILHFEITSDKRRELYDIKTAKLRCNLMSSGQCSFSYDG